MLRPGASLYLPAVVARFEALGVATYKWPQRLEVLDTLPSTASGKIRKHAIVASLVARDAGGAEPNGPHR